jgi:ABC-type sugar transport system permease subunit
MDQVKRKGIMDILGLPLRVAAAAALFFLGTMVVLRLLRDGFYPLASMAGAIMLFLILIFVKKRLAPYRWLAAGISLAVLFTVYPILYTVFLSFTNMSGGHLLTKQQAIAKIQTERYIPEGARTYSWTAYSGHGGLMLLLVDDEGRAWTAKPGLPLEPFDLQGDPPETIGDYAVLDPIAVIQRIQELSAIAFGPEAAPVYVDSPAEAAETRQRYAYDPAADAFTETETGRLFRPVDGTFISEDGEALVPGFISGAGVRNYSRFLGNRGYLRPIGEILLWNVAFSALSVLFSFLLGLTIALLFENLPGRRIIRSILIIPYPIPVLVSIMVWRGLLNDPMGLVTGVLTKLFGSAPKFFNETGWTRFAVILINVYLSYPYFYILCAGALKSIPAELYEAAEIDGAGPLASLRSITLPMLLRILSPLLIASFTFNFNNFTIIWGFNAGLPAMPDSIVPMGRTDLLISFIYRLGFGTANAADYGFSGAITVLLFLLVGLMVLTQTLRSRSLKEAD